MSCVTGKKCYYDEHDAEEALIRSHINFARPAVNYYLCDNCNEYHLTSQGEINQIIFDPKVKERISREQREMEWQKRLR